MKIFLTGMTGHLGFNILIKLIERGHEVTAGVRDSEFAASLIEKYISDPSGITIVKTDLSDLPSLVNGTGGADCVINAAAVVGLRREGEKEQMDTNIRGVGNLLDACIENGVRRFIQISTIQTVKSGTREKPGSETGPADQEEVRDPYTKSKIASDRLALSYTGRGLDVIVLSPGLLTGPYDIRASAITNLFRVTGNGASLFYPRGGITISDVENVADCVADAAVSGKSGERYLLGGVNMSYREIYMILHGITGCPRPIIPIPETLMRITAAVMGFFEKKFNATFTVSSHRVLLVCRQEFYSSKKAETELGYKKTDAEASFRKSYRWLLENGRIKRKKPAVPADHLNIL
ncbi:MAG: NAD-dependent epimerase/dehydratase family protein [Spirochaetes bacterium]|nr:NAD-dependent epimerase/dehydratase family protein [Spirochaetota bacterium]